MLQVPFITIMEDESHLYSQMVYSMEREDVEIEPNLALDNKAFVVVKFEMPDDSATSTDHFPHNVPDFPESKIKTESIIHKHQVCDSDTTYDDIQHTIESNTICVKHEYKFGDDRTHVMSHTEEVGTSVVVTSGMPYDSGMPTSDFMHNVINIPDSKIKTESIVHPKQDRDANITHNDVNHSSESHSICLKHEYKYEEDTAPDMTPSVDDETVCTTDIDRQYTCDTCTKSFRYKGELRRHFRIHTGEKTVQM
jgi:hypothetical protein